MSKLTVPADRQKLGNVQPPLTDYPKVELLTTLTKSEKEKYSDLIKFRSQVEAIENDLGIVSKHYKEVYEKWMKLPSKEKEGYVPKDPDQRKWGDYRRESCDKIRALIEQHNKLVPSPITTPTATKTRRHTEDASQSPRHAKRIRQNVLSDEALEQREMNIRSFEDKRTKKASAATKTPPATKIPSATKTSTAKAAPKTKVGNAETFEGQQKRRVSDLIKEWAKYWTPEGEEVFPYESLAEEMPKALKAIGLKLAPVSADEETGGQGKMRTEIG